MAKRKLLKDPDRRKLVDIPIDEDSLIRQIFVVIGGSHHSGKGRLPRFADWL